VAELAIVANQSDGIIGHLLTKSQILRFATTSARAYIHHAGILQP